MTDRPILFSGPMVRAILEGRKTQTRRVLGLDDVNQQPDAWSLHNVGSLGYMAKPSAKGKFGATFESREIEPSTLTVCPQRLPYAPGDRLWVRETWQGLSFGDYQPTKSRVCDVRYKATDRLADLDTEARGYPWRPSIFMPRWASRLTLLVTDVRVQRLQDISEDDARAEGIERMKTGRGYYDPTVSKAMVRAGVWHRKATHAFAALWDSLNAKRGYGWDANPWVCAVTFTAHQHNIDQVEAANG